MALNTGQSNKLKIKEWLPSLIFKQIVVVFEKEQRESLVSWALLTDLTTFRAPEPSPYRVSLDWGDTFLVLFHVT